MHKNVHWAAIGVFSLACAGAALAQAKDKAATMGASAAKSSAMCPSDDSAKLKTVLQFLHGANENEIKHGKLAADRAQSPQIKEFADRMVKDHTDADKKLSDFAKKKNIDLAMATPMDPIHAAVHGAESKMQQALESKNGPGFDAAYLGPEAHEHMMVLAVIDEGLKVAKDDESKKLLNDYQSVVTAHRDHAISLSDKMMIHTMPKAIGGGPKK